MAVVIRIDTEIEAPKYRKKEVLRYLGYTDGACDEKTEALIESCYKELSAVITPKACFTEGKIERTGGGYLSVCGIDLESRDLEKNLSGCDRAAVFGATLGVGADRLIAKYSNVSPSKSVVIDAVASSLIEVYCDAVCEMIAYGRALNPRFSAGYGDLAIESQTKISDLLSMQKNVGVCLTASLLMTPTKSVTAIVGIRKEK
jgi:5-methyltetrahydrofolate--homocysteine methyltransferase